MIQWKYAKEPRELITREHAGVPFLSFKALEETGIVINGFSTRLGGVSQGRLASMNFSTAKGDTPERVRENFTRMAAALGVERDKMVLSWQTHTVNVRRVTAEDAGKGVVRERDYRDVDGLITDVPGITLVTLYADCVPLYLVDTVHRAIGLSHSGWRGTVRKMGQVTLTAMGEAFGTRPEDVTVCIGPSICQDCFEVGEEVAEAFLRAFPAKYHSAVLKPGRQPGKYQADLWEANRAVFLVAGTAPERIHVTDICTRCNSQYLFSHREHGTERGNLGAFLCLKQPSNFR